MTPSSDIAVVVIGRNEGARLVASLASLQGAVSRIVYVDSGSTDDSVEVARDAGAIVVALDLSIPFTAARARNAGFAALDPVPDFVQFMDGDCVLEKGWISAGLAAMEQNADLGIVTGWCIELLPEASVYNGMADFDWRRPTSDGDISGDIEVCGGNMIVRSSLIQDIGGFNPHVIASEDEEFCIRVGKSGWRIYCLPATMVKHDANIMHFAQWWQRAVRTGHGFAQVGALHPPHFLRPRQRAWFFGAVLPVAALVSLLLSPWFLIPILALYILSYYRTVQGLLTAGLAPRKAFHHSVFLSLSKFPNLIGMLTYYGRTLRGGDMAIIEYK